jgi:hypothetical protein
MNLLAVISALICFLFPPVPAKYVEGQLNDSVQVCRSLLLFNNQMICSVSIQLTFSTEVDFPCSVLLSLDGREIFL